jgi:hypothetical protein
MELLEEENSLKQQIMAVIGYRYLLEDWSYWKAMYKKRFKYIPCSN